MEEMTRRELAFCYIYSQEIQKENSKAQVKLFLDSTEVEDGRTREYVKNVASGIKEHGEEITEKIAKNLKTGWTIERISKVDVSLLKLAIYEMNYMQTPFKIIINEVVNMAKKYGEDSSPAFVNFVLEKIVEQNLEVPIGILYLLTSILIAYIFQQLLNRIYTYCQTIIAQKKQ